MIKTIPIALLAIIACLLWSTAFAGIKIGLPYTTPLQFAGIRFMLAGLMILPFCSSLRANVRTMRTNLNRLLLISLFQTFGLYAFFYLGIARSTAAITALIVGAGPLFIGMMAHFVNHDEKFTPRKILSIGIGFLGILVIVLGRFGPFDGANVTWVGISFLLLSNISGSIGNILVSKTKTGLSPFFQNAFQLVVGGAGLLLMSLFFEPVNVSIKPWPYYLSLLWLSMISAVAFSLWFYVLQQPGIKVSEINVWKFIIPVVGATLSWWILPDEQPSIVVLAGMLLVGLSLIIMYTKRK